MNRKLAELAERRSLLVAQAAAQRAGLARDAAPLRVRLALVDQGMEAARYVAHRPALIVGAVLLLAALRPRRAGRWLQRGWLAWQLGRSLRRS